MQIPSVPTDNLYKFMAIAGLLLAGITMFYTSSQAYKLELKITESTVRIAAIKRKTEGMARTIDAFEKANMDLSASQVAIMSAQSREVGNLSEEAEVNGTAESAAELAQTLHSRGIFRSIYRDRNLTLRIHALAFKSTASYR